MASEAPPFWWEPADWRAHALAPASALYGWVAARRMTREGVGAVDAPVLCVGNFTVGGTGKTPVAIAFAEAARAAGLRPGMISRGHGGSSRSARLVNPKSDSAALVGDEPLVLARHAPVAVSRKRIDAAEMLIREGCDFLIMDDGFQSARIRIDYALMVVDAGHGVGNGRVIPGGPLRAPLVEQLRRADAVLRMGAGDAAEPVVRMAARAGKPIHDAAVRPIDAEWAAGRRVLAFAGIGHPRRFFDTLARAGAEVVEQRVFADHHVFSSEQVAELDAAARKAGLDLVTTEKDAARLTASLVPDGFRERLRVLKVAARFENPDVPGRIVAEAVAAYKARKASGG